MNRRIFVVLGTILLFTHSFACGWDNDTLTAESKGIPELLDALVGRIAIYPKEYYEFRIARSSKIVQSDPTNFNELDNLIVAYDKVGDYPKAFASASLKLKALKLKPNKEHEYRYYANLGTIEAHEWLRRGDHTDKSLLDQSIKDLRRCIEINPDAHFGREMVQVKLIEMIRKSKDLLRYPEIPEARADYPIPDGPNTEEWEKFVVTIGEAKVQKGIIGIMSLGSGPDSPDLLCAILPTIPDKKGNVREVGLHRIDDLWRNKPIYSGIGYEMQLRHPADKKLFSDQYKALAEESKIYRQKLTEYIRSKLSGGLHPDVDPHFWEDWKEPDHVDLRAIEPILTQQKITILLVIGLLLLPIFGIVAAVILLKWITRKTRSTKRS